MVAGPVQVPLDNGIVVGNMELVVLLRLTVPLYGFPSLSHRVTVMVNVAKVVVVQEDKQS